jgi:hypothetical protein
MTYGGVEVQLHAPIAFPSVPNGPQGLSGRCDEKENILLRPGNEPRFVGSHYTDSTRA